MTNLPPALRIAAVPDVPGLHILGCLERYTVSIQHQQVRALNLVWAMQQAGVLRSGQRVAVVGGGFAGLTAAACASRLGAQVLLVERQPELLSWQRNNRTRWIHPHIHGWPRPGSENRDAGLPILTWRASLAADMAAQILGQWDAEVTRGAMEVVLGASPASVGLDGPLRSLRLGDGPPRELDHVILALGLGIERSFGNLPLTSYWFDERVVASTPGRVTRHLVTGTGEGGLIDALYLCLTAFSHAELAAALGAVPAMEPVKRALLAIEAEADALDDEAANRLLADRYDELPVPPEADDVLRSRLRTDTRVTLNGPERSPISRRGDLINRFLIHRLWRIGALDYRSGHVATIDTPPGRYDVRFEDGVVVPCEHVHVRHGVVPTLQSGFPEIWARYAPARLELGFAVPERTWPAGFPP